LEISKVLYNAWLIAYKDIFRKEFLEELEENRWVPFLIDMFDKNSGSILVAENEGEIIGVSLFGSTRDGIKGHGEVYSFYVIPEYWRKSFGRQLMEGTLESLKENYEIADVWVLEENERAIGFYEALGFIKCGQEKNIVEDEILLPHILLTQKFKEAN